LDVRVGSALVGGATVAGALALVFLVTAFGKGGTGGSGDPTAPLPILPERLGARVEDATLPSSVSAPVSVAAIDRCVLFPRVPLGLDIVASLIDSGGDMDRACSGIDSIVSLP